MGFLTAFFEQRALDESSGWALITKALRGRGDTVTPANALQLSVVFSCVRVLSESVAMLPLGLFEKQAKGRRRAQDHRLYSILHDLPNPEMTSVEVRAAMMGHLAGWGNAYAQKVFDGAGRVIELWPLRPDRMDVMRAPNDDLIYHYRGPTGSDYFQAAEIMHLRGLSNDGLIGYSPITMARRAFQVKSNMETYQEAFWENDAQPGVVLKHPQKLSDKAFVRLQESWQSRHGGPGNAGKMAILEEGLSLETIGIPQGDAQFIESQKLSRAEIAGLFRVPSHMVNDLDRATFASVEQMSLEFVIYTLTPWLTVWEQAIWRDLLTEQERRTYYAKHEVQALLRGDNASRSQFYASGLQWGYFSINDVLGLEDMNPIADGDTHFVPVNMAPLQLAVTGGAAVTQTPAPSTKRAALYSFVEDTAYRLCKRAAVDLRTRGVKAFGRGADEWTKWVTEQKRDLATAGAVMIAPLVRASRAMGSKEPDFTVDALIGDWATRLESVMRARKGVDGIEELAAWLEGDAVTDLADDIWRWLED